MKVAFKTLVLLALAASLAVPARAVSYDTFTTGEEWLDRMSYREKLISLVLPILLFQRYGIPLERTPEQYVETIDQVLVVNPYLGKEDVSNIFASTVYAYEPDSREKIDELVLASRLRLGVYKDLPMLLPIRQPAEKEPAPAS